jgi:hypothetical protein
MVPAGTAPDFSSSQLGDSMSRFNLGLSCPPDTFRENYGLGGLGLRYSKFMEEFPMGYRPYFSMRHAADDADDVTLPDADRERYYMENIQKTREMLANPAAFGLTAKVSPIPSYAQWTATNPEIMGDNSPEYQYLWTHYNLPLNEGDFWENFVVPAAIGVATALMTGGTLPTSGFEGTGTFSGSVAAHGGGLLDIFTPAGSAPVEAVAVDPQAIDGSMQTIYDANAAAGVPGYDPTLTAESLFVDPQAIDGSMQTIYDEAANAGTPGYDPSLTYESLTVETPLPEFTDAPLPEPSDVPTQPEEIFRDPWDLQPDPNITYEPFPEPVEMPLPEYTEIPLTPNIPSIPSGSGTTPTIPSGSGSGITIPGTTVTIPPALVTTGAGIVAKAITGSGSGSIPGSGGGGGYGNVYPLYPNGGLQPARDPKTGNLTADGNKTSIVVGGLLAALVVAVAMSGKRGGKNSRKRT